MELRKRKHPRLQGYDCGQAGHYFVTLCVKDRKPVLSSIPPYIAHDHPILKTMVTRKLGRSIWQTSFYDHIIRDEKDFLNVCRYIDENPAKWAEDDLFCPAP